MREVNREGFTILHEGSSPTVDIIFIHGFTGHPRKTWTQKNAKHARDEDPAGEGDEARRQPKHRGSFFSRSSSKTSSGLTTSTSSSSQTKKDIFWPEDLLPHSFPQSRILTYGYDTNIKFRGQVSQNSVYQHAWDFLVSLASQRNGTDRPILFIAHSLGGIIVKEALRRSRGVADAEATAYLANVYDATAGVIFFGTPHRGADPRSFVHHVAQAALEFLGAKVNEQIASSLMPNAERLAELNDEFPHMCRHRQWLVHSFQEQYGVGALLDRKVVEDGSSCIDDRSVEVKQHIGNNHMDMCRFLGPQDLGYAKVVDAIKRILQAVEKRNGHGSFQPPPHPDTNECPRAVFTQQQTYSRHDDVPIQPEFVQPPHGSAHRALDIETRQQLLEKLKFEQIDARLTGLDPVFKSTCQWLFEKDEYKKWQDADCTSDANGFLWIKGNPGTGKSTQMKVLFERAHKYANSDHRQICLSFFFHARGVLEEKSTPGLYRSLLHQLFQQTDLLPESLEWTTNDGARGIAKNGWHQQALKQTLAHAIEHLGNRSLTIFVDALDECDQTQAADMVSHFEELCDRASELKVRLRICFSSRHYPEIYIQNGTEVVLEEEDGHRKDIASFIKAKLRTGNSKSALALHEEILERSSQIFLWVVLVIEIINTEFRKPTGPTMIKKIQARVREIPPKLHDLFEMILKRDGESLEELRICLNVVLFALRPLDPQELYFAVHLGLDPSCSTAWDRDDLNPEDIKRFVRSCSKGLAEVARNKAAKVQFIHESVRDFLLGKYGTQWSGAAENIKGHGHEMMRDCCLAQIEATIEGIPESLPPAANMKHTRLTVSARYPFLEYAVTYLFKHSDQAQGFGLKQDDFLGQVPLPQWVYLSNTCQMYDTRRYNPSVTLLYVLAIMDLQQLILLVPRAGHSCFAVEDERYGTPLLAAMAVGSNNAARAMLQAQAYTSTAVPELRDLCVGLASSWSTCNLPKADITFRFSLKIPIATQATREWGDAILAALAHQYCTADGQIDDKRLGQALTVVAKISRQDISSAFLSHLMNVNPMSQECAETALCASAEHGHAGITEMLLQRGVDVESKRHPLFPQDTPLVSAARNCHESVVKLLLSAKADVEAVGRDWRTALSLAAGNGHYLFVQQLLEAKANVEAKDHLDYTPLVSASKNGHEAVVRALLEAGANVQARDMIHRETPLMKASANGHETVVRALLEAGANVEAKDHEGWTPLMHASRCGRETVVRALLEAGANVEAKDQHGWTPLMHASICVHETVVRVLLASKADIEAQNNEGRTSLALGCIRGSESVARILIDGGANLETKDDSGQTPLMLAAERSKISFIELLLDAKVDVEAQDGAGHTALWHAFELFSPAGAKLLLERGARVTASHLERATRWRSPELSSLLRSYMSNN